MKRIKIQEKGKEIVREGENIPEESTRKISEAIKARRNQKR